MLGATVLRYAANTRPEWKPPESRAGLLIRRGETAWSLTGQHTRRTDIALTENGEAEARELKRRLARIRFSRVIGEQTTILETRS